MRRDALAGRSRHAKSIATHADGIDDIQRGIRPRPSGIDPDPRAIDVMPNDIDPAHARVRSRSDRHRSHARRSATPLDLASIPRSAGSGQKKGRAMSPGQCVDGCGDRDAVLQPFEVL